MSDLSEIKSALDQVNAQVREFGEQARAEIEKHARLSAETRTKVDELLVEQGGLRAQVQTAEQLIATINQRGTDRAVRAPSMGEQVIGMEQVKQWLANPSGKLRVPVKAVITSGGASAGDLVVPQRMPGIVMPGQQRLVIRDLLPWGRTSSNAVEFVRELAFTNNANVVRENPTNGKPESTLTFEEDSAAVATIAHFVRATKQILADAPMLQAYIDIRLRYGLKLVEEDQLLNGSGSGLNIDGLVNQASSYSDPGVTVQAETRLDRLRLALLQVELTNYYGDGIVLSPIDWTSIELTKDENNNYLFVNPHGLATPTLWGRPVVPTQSMDAGDYLVGAFQMGAMGWDREDVNVALALEDADNFTKNLVTVRCEERLALTVLRPDAFVTGDFDGLEPS